MDNSNTHFNNIDIALKEFISILKLVDARMQKILDENLDARNLSDRLIKDMICLLINA